MKEVHMKLQRLSGTILGLIILFVMVISCEDDYPKSLYQPDEEYRANPVVEDIQPDSILGGVGIIEILGENFSPNPEENTVYFNSVQARVLNASETRLEVAAPNEFGDSVRIKVDVDGSLLFGEFFPYKVRPVLKTFASFQPGVTLYSLAIDAKGQIYVSMGNQQIRKFDPEGAPIKTFNWTYPFTNSLRTGPDGQLYGIVIGRIKFVVAVDTTDGSTENVASLSKNPSDLDFDETGAIWLSAGGSVLRVDNGTSSEVANYADIELDGIRYFDGSLYLLSYSEAEGYALWSAPVEGESLGEKTLVGNLTEAYGDTVEATSMEMDASGAIYIGTTSPHYGIVILDQSGNFTQLYPDLVSGPIYDMNWGAGSYLFAAGQQAVDGETVPAILRIDTQQEGAIRWGRENN